MNRHSRTQWFKELFEALGEREHKALDLVAQVKIPEGELQAIRAAARRYICSCLGISDSLISEEALLQRLETGVDQLANRTPNGELLPKQEFAVEFNGFHRAVAVWLKNLGLDRLIHQVSCPVVIRIVKGTSSPKLEARPYASSKLHVDLWNGDPADGINVLIPLWGDVARTTVEFYKPPDDFEDRFLRMMSDYSEAGRLMSQCEPYPIQFRMGYAHFMDAVVLHRTVNRGGKIRVSIQLQLRRKTPPEERARVEATCDRERLKGYFLSPEDWYALGVKRYMKFSDTYTDAQSGIFVRRPYHDAMYQVVDAL